MKEAAQNFQRRWWFLIAQAFVAFNDNAAKAMLFGLVTAGIVEDSQTMRAIISQLLIIPFILLASLAGWTSDRFSKRAVISNMLLLQLAGVGLLFAACYLQLLWLALTAFGLLAVQTCFYAPAKRGFLREVVTGAGFGQAVGFMELLNMAGIIGGNIAGGLLYDAFYTEDTVVVAWEAAGYVALILCGTSVLSWLLFQPMRYVPAVGARAFTLKVLGSHLEDLRYIREQRELWWTTLGWSWFYALGVYIMLALSAYYESQFGTGSGTASATGLSIAYLGGGVILGNFIAARASRKRIAFGLVGVGAFGLGGFLSLVCLVLWFAWSPALNPLFLACGICAGLFIVPVQAHLQAVSEPRRRGRILASASLVMNITQLLVTGLQMVLGAKLGLHPAVQMGVLAASAFVMAWWTRGKVALNKC